MDRIRIYDTTLRDGMQAEGVGFSLADKIMIANRIDEFGMDYIEGGYAAANPKEMQFFRHFVEKPLKNSRLAAFGNTRRADKTVENDPSMQSILETSAPVATIVGKTWDLHVTEVLKCRLDENIAICVESIEYLKKKGLEVIFDAEHFFDGYKHNAEYALKVVTAAANAGADAIILCETNGGALPNDVYDVTSTVCKTISGANVGIHCHNDTECAVANSIEAVRAGARHVQGTVNGLGERTGNANLCSIIPNLSLKMGFETVSRGKISSITELSRYICEVANMNPVMNMPYVGESAFAHKAGLHVNAIRKNKSTYEHIDPSAVGNERRFLISELSGASNVLAKLEKKQVADNTKLAKQILNTVQDLENQGYQFEAADASFDIIVKKAMGTYKPAFDLIKYHVNVEQITAAGEITTEATIKLKVGDEIEHVVSEGDGPVNALDGALRKCLLRFYPALKDMHLIDYKVRVVNAQAATAAKVRVIIESRDKDAFWGTVGVSENIIEASWKALVDSVEFKLLKDAEKRAK